MKKGDQVKIYEDPITCKIFEGNAKLNKKLNENEEIEYWSILFLDGLRGIHTQRWVNKINH